LKTVLVNIAIFSGSIWADDKVKEVKMDFKTLSKTDKLSLQLTSVDPAKPNLEPERSINYHTEESAVEMINDGYSVVYNLKDRECWDIQDYLQDN
jgi:hypothetical protein